MGVPWWMGHPNRIKLLRMIRKNDYALAATSARSYNRHWRAKKLTWNEIGKIKYLFDGAIEYMDEVTLAYTSNSFSAQVSCQAKQGRLQTCRRGIVEDIQRRQPSLHIL